MASEPRAHCIDLKWRSEDVKLQEKADFTSLLLSDKVSAGLEKSGFKTPSPIQLEAIPIGRFGKDLVVQAKSGTGKTLVFTIVALEMLLDVKHPQVLVMAPTREIASQICSVIQTVGSEFKDLKCCSFIGGTLVNEDRQHAHDCQIAVGTPGRIKQLINLGVLKTNSIRLFVLDEADQLLDSGFITEVDDIFLTLPKDKQVIATSATYPKKLKKLVNRYFRKPYLARLNAKELALLGMVHYTYHINCSDMAVLVYKQKLACLEKILSTVTFTQCLVFCNMVSRVKYLSADIRKWGFSTASISSAKEQAARLKAINNLKSFKCKILVSSDLTSRGIDAENVDLVINFDAPSWKEVYLHRAGRAGRYGSKGVTITFLNEKELPAFKHLETGGHFKTYHLPDPIPANLINIRPSFVESAQTELIPMDSSEEPIAENNVHNESDQDNINENSDKRSFENGELQISVNDKGVLESSIAVEIKSASFLDQNVDSNLCRSSNIETKPPEAIQSENNKGGISLTDAFELSDSSTESAVYESLDQYIRKYTSQSCMDEYAESQNKIENSSSKIPEAVREDKAKEDSVVKSSAEFQNKIENLSSEIPETVRKEKAKEDSVASNRKVVRITGRKRPIKKLEPKVTPVDVCKTIENIDEDSIKNLGFETNSGSQMHETVEDLTETLSGIQSTSEFANKTLREMCSSISNFIVHHEKNKDSALPKAEIVKRDIHSPDFRSDSLEPSSRQRPICSKDIVQLGADLSEYYHTVLKSFTDEHMQNNPKVTVTEEDETEIYKVPIEKKSTSHKNSLPENQLQNNYEDESGKVEKTERNSIVEEKFLESTPIKGEVIFTAKTDDSSDSSSSYSFEASHSLLVLKQKFKEMVQESYKKQPPRNGFMPKLSANNLCFNKKNISQPTGERLQSYAAVFISSSVTSSESSVVSETSSKASDESSETSDKSSETSGESSGISDGASGTSYESSETSDESSSDSDSYEIQKPKHQRGPKATSAYSGSTIASKDGCTSKQLSRRNKKQQLGCKSTYNFPDSSNQNNQVYNSSRHNVSDISRHQKTCDMGHGNFPCTNSMERNSHFSGLQYINQLPYNCSQLTHQCHSPLANSNYQSHLYKQWYDTFYAQWQHIHYSSYFH